MARVFLHGGPGSNSLAESHLIPRALRKGTEPFYFWNEPSKQRPNGNLFNPEQAYQRWRESAANFVANVYQKEGPVHLIAHSFASLPALELANGNSRMIRKLTLIAPALRLHAVFLNILRMGVGEFRSAGAEEKAAKLASAMEASKNFLDAPMVEGFGLAAEAPGIFSRYWYNPERMKEYYSIWAQEKAAFDVESFIAVCMDLAGSARQVLPQRDEPVPTQLIYGRHDPIIDADEETAVAWVLMGETEVVTFENSGHYPHIEETERFLSLLSAGR